MSSFIFIITSIIMPIFLIIAVGFVVQKKFSLHIATLSKLQIYVLVPSLIFNKIYFTQLSGEIISKVVIFNCLLFIILTAVGMGVARMLGMSRGKEKSFINSVTLRNIGNYGIPLITLLYAGESSDYAMSIHMIAVIISVILMYTIGLYNASSGQYTGKDALKKILSIPTIYAILIASVLKMSAIDVSDSIISVTTFFSAAVVPIALIALGGQLAETKFKFGDYSVYIGSTIRLLISPLIALGLVSIMNFDSIASSVLIIGAGTPIAVNSLFLAIEFDGDADYASQTVFISTLLSAITISIVIFFIR